MSNKQTEEKKVFSKIETYKPTFWERIMLWFAKPYYGVDLGCGKDKSVKVKCKKFGGQNLYFRSKGNLKPMNKTTLENWEAEFDYRYGVTKNNSLGDIEYFADGMLASDVKNFIKDLLASSQKDEEKAAEEEINRLYLVAEARGFLIGIASKLDNKRKKAALNIAERLGESNTRKLQSLNSKGQQ